MSRVVFRDLVKTYPDKTSAGVTAVDRINLSIEPGEFMVLVGPSGCGKSTTLRMLAGLEEISGGTIEIGDRVVNDLPPKDRDIAMVFQNYALYPHLTVFENLAFGLRLRKTPKPEMMRRVGEAAALLGLSELLDRKPKALSGGQRQRVAVGRAIVRQPKVFLFDEPLSNLDAKMRTAMRAEISRLHAKLGATMVYVTHDQVEAMTMGDRICVMKDGCIQQVATPTELYRKPANVFVAGFIGTPAMNLIAGLMTDDGVRQTFRAAGGELEVTLMLTPEPATKRDKAGVAAEEAAADRTIFLGVRPEHVRVGVGLENPLATTEIELVELMGAETHLHLVVGGVTLVARVTSEQDFRMGQRVGVGFDLDHLHRFDAMSGLAL